MDKLRDVMTVKELIVCNLVATKQLEPDKLIGYNNIAKNEQYFNQGIAQGYFILGKISEMEYEELIYFIHNFDMTPEFDPCD